MTMFSFGRRWHRDKLRFAHGQFAVHRGFLGLRFVLVQGEDHLVVVVTGELRVRDNRPLGRCAVGHLDAPLVNLDS